MSKTKKFFTMCLTVIMCLALIPTSFLHAEDQEITVYFHDTASDNVWIKTSDIEYIEMVTLEEAQFSIPENMEMVGWCASPDGNGTMYSENDWIDPLHGVAYRSSQGITDNVIGFNEDKTEFHVYAIYKAKDRMINIIYHEKEGSVSFNASYLETDQIEIFYSDILQYEEYFEGWTKTENSNVIDYYAGEVINGKDLPDQLHLYPVFRKNEQNVLKINYHDKDQVYTVETKSTDKILDYSETGLKNNRYNSVFKVWTDSLLGNPNGYEPGYPIDDIKTDDSHELNLYANFDADIGKVKNDKVKLIYHENIGDSDRTYVINDAVILSGINLKFHLQGKDVFKTKGYIFESWSWDKNGKSILSDNRDGKEMSIPLDYEIADNIYLEHDKELHLYANWVKDNQITVTFDANGGSGDVPEPITASKYDEIILPNHENLKKGDNYFKYWSLYKDGLSEIYYENSIFKLEDNITLYAVYDKGYHINYDINNKDLEGLVEAPTDDNLYAAGTYVSLKRLSDEEVNGYKFKGWSEDKNWSQNINYDPLVYQFEVMRNDVTLYAVWEKQVDVNVTYDCTYLNACPADKTYKSGDRILLTELPLDEQIKKIEGIEYLFTGWEVLETYENYTVSFKIDIEYDNIPYVIPSSIQNDDIQEITIVPQFTDKTSDYHKAVFDLNLGDGTYGLSDIVRKGSNIYTPDNNYLNFGYYLAGWTTDKDSKDPMYGVFDPLPKDVSVIYLYAIWEPIPEDEIKTIYINVKGEPQPRIIQLDKGQINSRSILEQIVQTNASYTNRNLRLYYEDGSKVDTIYYENIEGSTLNLFATYYYDIAYQAGEHGSLADHPLSSREEMYQKLTDIPTPIPDDGYKFKGWYLIPKLNNTVPQFLSLSNGTITMYLQFIWLENDGLKNTILTPDLFLHDIMDFIEPAASITEVTAIALFEPITEADVTVEYYYDNVQDKEATEIYKDQKVGSTFKDYIDKPKDYVFEKVEPSSVVVNEDSAKNVMKVYYISKKADVTVEYYYDNVQDKEATEVYKDQKVGSTFKDYIDKPKDYVFEKVEPSSVVVNEDSTKNVIKVYYVKDTKPDTPSKPVHPDNSEKKKGLDTFDTTNINFWLMIGAACIVVIFVVLLRKLYVINDRKNNM